MEEGEGDEEGVYIMDTTKKFHISLQCCLDLPRSLCI